MDRDPKIKDFLQKISQIESSGGKNLKHKLIKKGLQKGQQAIGSYGLLPNTIQEIVNRNKSEGRPSALIASLEGLPQGEYTNLVGQNPELEQEIAVKLANHVINKQEGDLTKAAYAWNMGHNKPSKSISDLDLQKSPYVAKFRKLSTIIGRGPSSIPEPQGLEEIPNSQIRIQQNPWGETTSYGDQVPGGIKLNMPVIQEPEQEPLITHTSRAILQNRKDKAIANAAQLTDLEKLWEYIKSFRDKPASSDRDLLKYKFFDADGNPK